MKKILLILTTLSLSGGTFVSFSNVSQQTKHYQTSPTNHTRAWAITQKIDHSVVKLDPNFWLNKNIEIYQTTLNATLVKEEILTQGDESGTSIIWQNLTIKQATIYNKVSFTVICQFSSKVGTTEFDVSTN